jgi:hypothetical protein
VRNNAIPRGRQLSLLDSRLLRGILSMGADRFPEAPGAIPPFYEVAPFRMVLILAVNDDMVFPHPAFTIEKNQSKGPLVIDFDLLEEFYL